MATRTFETIDEAMRYLLRDHTKAELIELVIAALGDDDKVWKVLEAEPGFNEEMEQGRRDIAEGRGTPFREVRRRTP